VTIFVTYLQGFNIDVKKKQTDYALTQNIKNLYHDRLSRKNSLL